MNPEILRHFRALSDRDWKVEEYGAGEWLLVDDAHTTWWCRSSEVTRELVNRLERIKADGECWVLELCEEIPGLKDSDVPAKVVAEARCRYDLDDDEEVARGW